MTHSPAKSNTYIVDFPPNINRKLLLFLFFAKSSSPHRAIIKTPCTPNSSENCQLLEATKNSDSTIYLSKHELYQAVKYTRLLHQECNVPFAEKVTKNYNRFLAHIFVASALLSVQKIQDRNMKSHSLQCYPHETKYMLTFRKYFATDLVRNMFSQRVHFIPISISAEQWTLMNSNSSTFAITELLLPKNTCFFWLCTYINYFFIQMNNVPV